MRQLILCASMVVWLGAQAQAADPCAENGELEYAGVVDGAIQLKWTGQIANKVDVKIFEAFSQHQDKAREIVLDLDSCGGHSRDMQETIKVLDLIKMTHRVNTRVGHGNTCGSACVFVFLAGKRRYGALTSSWLFHEAWTEVVHGADESIERQGSTDWTKRAFDKYFVPAGVSKKWLARVRRIIKDGDYWQTGRDLWESNSGVITEPIENLRRRKQRMYFMPEVVCGDFCRG